MNADTTDQRTEGMRRLFAWWQTQQAERTARKHERMAQEVARAREALLKLLLDPTNDAETRHEAAWELGSYQFTNAEVEQAYIIVALDHTVDSELAKECGENLGLIWSGKSSLDTALLKQFHPAAFDACTEIVLSLNPEREWVLMIFDIRWEYRKERRSEQKQ